MINCNPSTSRRDDFLASQNEADAKRLGIATSLAHPLNTLAQETHAISVSKGFYEPVDQRYLRQALPLMVDVSDLIDELTSIRKDIPAPEGIRVVDLDNEDLTYALKLLLIVSECVEAFHEVVAGDFDKEAFEIADIAIRLLDYAAARDIDLDAVVRAKMEQNKLRPRKHGARF